MTARLFFSVVNAFAAGFWLHISPLASVLQAALAVALAGSVYVDYTEGKRA